MKLNTRILKKMLRAVAGTREDELSCGDCYEQVDRFIELELEGKSAKEAMPRVEDHLRRCPDCLEEYEALLVALKKLGSSA